MSRELLKRALAEISTDYAEWYLNELQRDIEAYLAQPEPEPVAWMCSDESLMRLGYSQFWSTCTDKWNIPVYTSPPDQSAQVADLIAQRNMHEEIIKTAYARCKELEQQLAALQAKREPLSEQQIDACFDGLMPSGHGKSRYDIARLIEAAHSITGSSE